MSGYTKNFIRVTGDSVLASDFVSEFQLIDDAFNVASGHKHDGSLDEGPYIALISDEDFHNSIYLDTTNNEIDFNIKVASARARQMVLVDGALLPNTTNDMDLGSATFQWKDLHLAGTATVDGIVVDGTVDFTGAAVTGLEATSPVITGGTVDSTVIGGTTPAAATFTDITFTGTITGDIPNDLVLDTTPQFGGDVDMNGFSITTLSNADVVVNPDGTGVLSVAGTTNYENNVTADDDIPNKKYVDDATAEIDVPKNSSSGALDLDLADGNFFSVTLTENITSITFSNIPASNITPITIEFTQDGTGGWTVAGWPAAVKWPGNTQPTITDTAGAVDVVSGFAKTSSTIRLALAMADSK